MMKVLSLVLIAFLIVPTMAEAKKDRWSDGVYMGIGVGGGRIDADLNELGLGIPPPPTGTGETIVSNTYNNTAFAYKFFAGYRFIDYFAIEGGYVSFEDSDERLCFIDPATDDCANSRFTTPAELAMPTADTSIVSSTQWEVTLPFNGYTFYGVGILPFGERFEGFAKVGGISWKMKGTGRERVVGGFIDTNPPNPNQQAFPPGNPQVWVSEQNNNGTDLAYGFGFNFNSDSNISIRTEMEIFDIPNTNDVWFVSLSAIYQFDSRKWSKMDPK